MNFSNFSGWVFPSFTQLEFIGRTYCFYNGSPVIFSGTMHRAHPFFGFPVLELSSNKLWLLFKFTLIIMIKNNFDELFILLLRDVIKRTDVYIKEKFLQKLFCLLFTRKIAFTLKTQIIRGKQKMP